ncbi:MAG: YfhO family protein, partial [Chlorobiales bacterium]|nr:YfhO family protein [Chlorobiales bacterium]
PERYLEKAFARDEVTDFLGRDSGLFRIYPAGPLFTENKFSVFGIESTGGYHPAKLKAYDEMLRVSSNLSHLDLLRMLNVRYVVSALPLDHRLLDTVYDGELRLVRGPVRVSVYRLTDAMPRAWFVREGIAEMRNEEVYRKLLGGEIDIATQALVENPPWNGTKQFGSADLSSIRVGPERIELSVDARRQAFLVLSEVYYPLRWKVTIDGREQTMYRTNGILRGVPVPEGAHEIVFSFDRSGFENGTRLSFAGFAVALLLVGTGFPGMKRMRRA